MSLFKNGSFLASGLMTNTVANSSQMWLGNHAAAGYPLIGGIDDVRITIARCHRLKCSSFTRPNARRHPPPLCTPRAKP